jgi:hypothetical protein
VGVELIGCEGSGNSQQGLVTSATATGSPTNIRITGGGFGGNSGDGISIASAISTAIDVKLFNVNIGAYDGWGNNGGYGLDFADSNAALTSGVAIGCSFTGNSSGNVGGPGYSSTATPFKFRDCTGFVTDQYGSVGLLSGTATVTFPSTMAAVPNTVSVTAGSSTNAGNIWVSGLSTTGFTIFTSGTSTATVYWEAKV